MNKTELINNLASKSYVKKLTGLEDLMLASQDIKLYAQHYIEAIDNVAKETKAEFFVFDEGLETEEAYYKDRSPSESVQPTHPLVKKYQATIDSVNGKVIDKGEGFIVVTGYEEDTQTGNMIPKTWFAEEVDGALAVKEVV